MCRLVHFSSASVEMAFWPFCLFPERAIRSPMKIRHGLMGYRLGIGLGEEMG
jgi:hypothetical protein